METLQWSAWDWLAVFLYLVTMIFIGWFVSRKIKSADDYLMAGRSLTFPIVIATMAATWYGTGGIFGAIELSFKVGIACFLIWGVPAQLGRIPLALWVAPKVRNLKETTIPALLLRLYARPVAILGAILILFYSSRLQDIVSVGIMGNTVTGLPNYVVGAVVVTIVVTYSLFGGLWSVVMTDVFQFLLMMTLTVLVLVPVWDSVGGFEGMQQVLPASYFEPMGNMPMAQIIVFVLLGLQVYADPTTYQRFSASKDAKTAKRAYLVCLCIWVAFDACMTMLGMASKVLYPELQGSKAFLVLAVNHLPPFLAGLYISSILAAIMSTMSSFYLIGAATLTCDLIQPCLKHKMSNATQILVIRICLVGLGIVGCFFAFQFDDVLEAILFLSGLYLASAFVPVIGGLFWKGKLTVAGGFFSMLGGLVTVLIWQFLGNPYELQAMLVALPISLILFMIGNCFGKNISRRDILQGGSNG